MSEAAQDPHYDEIRWSWQSRDTDLRVGYLSMRGRVSMADLIAHMSEIAPGVSLDDIDVNFGTVTWTRPANADELSRRAEQIEAQRVRQERWERETLARLTEKYTARAGG